MLYARDWRFLVGLTILVALTSSLSAQADGDSKVREIQVAVTDAQGKPLPGAMVLATEFRKLAEGVTDDEGRVALRIPADKPLQAIVALKDGHGLDYVLYRQQGEPVSDPYKRAPESNEPVHLQLTGARPVIVRTIDELGAPLAGVEVYPWYFERPKKGGYLNTSGLEAFKLTSDASGSVVFRMIPIDQRNKLAFWARLDKHYTPKRPIFDPAQESNEVVAAFVPLMPLRGKVTDENGKPMSGVAVQVSGSGYQFDDFHSTVNSAADGSFEILVYPDQYYVLAARNDRSVSTAVHRLVLSGKDIEPVELKLQPGRRIYGQLTQGNDKQPIAGHYLTVYQKEWDIYYELPTEKRLPNPLKSNKAITPVIAVVTQTDEQGRYEFFGPPAKYYIMSHLEGDTPQFEITDQREFEVNLHAKVNDRLPFKARVVNQADPKQGVAEAKIWGISTGRYRKYLEGVSGKDGVFEGTRSAAPMYVQAKSEDGLLSGIVRWEGTQADFSIPVQPTATARGRLLDAKSKAPLPDRQIQYGYRVTNEDGTFSSQFGGTTTTNVVGEFVLTGLTPGWRFEIDVVLELDSEGHPSSRKTVGTVTPKDAGLVDLGDLTLIPPPHRLTLDDWIEREMPAGRPLAERFASKLRDAELAEQLVLVMATPKGSPLCRQFFGLRYGFSGSASDRERYFEAAANYALLPVDTWEGKSLDEARAVLEKSKIPIPEPDDVTFAIVDGRGRLVATVFAKDLLQGDLLDFAKLSDFLRANTPKLPDAERLLADALAQAKREKKKILVQHSGAFCVPCILLSRFLDKHSSTWRKDYVYLKLDERFEHGKEVVQRLRPKQGGIPWMVILDADGRPLINSDGPKGNIGFPGSPVSIAHFEEMLRSTSRLLTDDDLKTMLDELANPR